LVYNYILNGVRIVLKKYINSLKNKKVGFIGIGISNMPIIKIFADADVDISIRDIKDISNGEFSEELKNLGVKIITGDTYLDDIYEDILFLSPGVKQFMPKLQEAKEKGVYLTTEMQEFLSLCPCKTVGVTGSDGKTTTTTLIAKLLELEGYTVHLGGNIGKNLFASLDNIKPDDYAIVELSSFQLMKMQTSPNIAVITNLSPNHLDWHRDMDEYIEAKCNIFKYQAPGEKCIFNATNTITKSIAETHKNAVFFGKGEGDFSIRPDGIYKGNELILADSDILLRGAHNRENYAAAIAATYGLVSNETITKLAKSFGGVEHRIELVRIHKNISYYNSSIDSSPSRTKAALESFDKKVIVIAGGYDKNIPLDPLGDLFCRKAKAVVLMGNTGPKIKAVLEKCGYTGEIAEVKDMENAVNAATKFAIAGDDIILSPAAASFDLFKNFMERGNIYKKIVNEL